MNSINDNISNKMKYLRNEKGLSLDQLSSMTGVSKSMLSQIERGNVNPTVNILWKIANGLKVSYTSLISNSVDVEVIKVGTPMLEDDGKYRLFPIFQFDPSTSFEGYRVEIEPNSKLEADSHGKGVIEYITVFIGTLQIRVGDKHYEIKKHESIKFLADQPHSYSNKGDCICEFSLQIFYNN